MSLAHDIVERPRSEPCRERRSTCQFGFGSGGEEISHGRTLTPPLTSASVTTALTLAFYVWLVISLVWLPIELRARLARRKASKATQPESGEAATAAAPTVRLDVASLETAAASSSAATSSAAAAGMPASLDDALSTVIGRGRSLAGSARPVQEPSPTHTIVSPAAASTPSTPSVAEPVDAIVAAAGSALPDTPDGIAESVEAAATVPVDVPPAHWTTDPIAPEPIMPAPPDPMVPEAVVAVPAAPIATEAAVPPASAPEPVDPAPSVPPTPPRLADLLDGLELPEAIIPVRTVVKPRDDYLALSASGVQAESVGASVADELERLGYELSLLSDADALATRGPDAVSIRIHPEASIGLDGVARPGSGSRVLVELWSGGGARPS